MTKPAYKFVTKEDLHKAEDIIELGVLALDLLRERDAYRELASSNWGAYCGERGCDCLAGEHHQWVDSEARKLLENK